MQPEDEESRNHDKGVRQRKIARRKRPESLPRMMAIGVEVDQVVEEIAARRATSERHKRQQRLFE